MIVVPKKQKVIKKKCAHFSMSADWVQLWIMKIKDSNLPHFSVLPHWKPFSPSGSVVSTH